MAVASLALRPTNMRTDCVCMINYMLVQDDVSVVGKDVHNPQQSSYLTTKPTLRLKCRRRWLLNY
jgi:hypothetical protein